MNSGLKRPMIEISDTAKLVGSCCLPLVVVAAAGPTGFTAAPPRPACAGALTGLAVSRIVTVSAEATTGPPVLVRIGVTTSSRRFMVCCSLPVPSESLNS